MRGRAFAAIGALAVAVLTAGCGPFVWYEALDSGFSPEGPKELGEPTFDAELTFEAVP